MAASTSRSAISPDPNFHMLDDAALLLGLKFPLQDVVTWRCQSLRTHARLHTFPEGESLCSNMKRAALALPSAATADEPCSMPLDLRNDMAEDLCCGAADHPQAGS